MEKQQSDDLLENIGGESLAGSGFEVETPVSENELAIGGVSDRQEAEDQ